MTETPESSSSPETPTGTPQTPPPPPPYPGAPGGYAPGNPQQYPPQYPPQGGYYLPPGASYPPPPPQPYAGYTPPPASPRNGLGIAALITAIVSLPAAISVFGGFLLGIVAIVLGFIGHSRAKRGEATNGGVAIAGIALGVLGIILSACVIAFGVWGFFKIGGRDYVDCMQKAGNDTSAQTQCEDQFRGNLENQFSVTLTPTP
ncbi:DUF4190 domain-containing protein [Mycolicibacterium komossense]|uniref:DUF4190 domain-containing protein n=1 Tax=Mycolicibacterium komossense TaxID=1779 RepID=A0ABT3CB84_9MYCO|nr:DUF4190 domain-containing protein [Mycolicibacterium komossense]MCV7226740.1 DUF4190 domain-containing protein [Mycolicibacterium komossense]